MKRGITFFDVLAIAAIVVFVAVLAFPIWAATCRPAGVKTAQLSNLKQLATGAAMYLGDADDRFMHAFGTFADNSFAFDRGMLTPADAKDYRVSVAHRLPESGPGWANSLEPYVKNYHTLGLPARDPEIVPRSELPAGAVTGEPLRIGVTYNGLLHAYKAENIQRPSRLPLFWSGLGRAEIENLSYSSPTLICTEPLPKPCSYIPAASGCSSSRNGATSSLIQPQGSMHVYGKGTNMAFTDTSAKFRSFGTQLAPYDTDFGADPFTGYDEKGYPRHFWWDGCHPWLFRPDYDFEEVGQ